MCMSYSTSILHGEAVQRADKLYHNTSGHYGVYKVKPDPENHDAKGNSRAPRSSKKPD